MGAKNRVLMHPLPKVLIAASLIALIAVPHIGPLLEERRLSRLPDDRLAVGMDRGEATAAMESAGLGIGYSGIPPELAQGQCYMQGEFLTLLPQAGLFKTRLVFEFSGEKLKSWGVERVGYP